MYGAKLELKIIFHSQFNQVNLFLIFYSYSKGRNDYPSFYFHATFLILTIGLFTSFHCLPNVFAGMHFVKRRLLRSNIYCSLGR